jgi:hypothetical protein
MLYAQLYACYLLADRARSAPIGAVPQTPPVGLAGHHEYSAPRCALLPMWDRSWHYPPCLSSGIVWAQATAPL